MFKTLHPFLAPSSWIAWSICFLCHPPLLGTEAVTADNKTAPWWFMGIKGQYNLEHFYVPQPYHLILCPYSGLPRMVRSPPPDALWHERSLPCPWVKLLYFLEQDFIFYISSFHWFHGNYLQDLVSFSLAFMGNLPFRIGIIFAFKCFFPVTVY